MSRIPWITLALSALLALSPFGQNAFYLAFQSGEALSRNIAGPIYGIGVVVAFIAITAEWAIRHVLWRRNPRRQGEA